MVLKLTLRQKFEFYSIIGFVLIIPIFILFDIVQMYLGAYNGVRDLKELISVAFTFILVALGLYWIRRRQLRFSEIKISISTSEFENAIKMSAVRLEWQIEKQSDNYLRAHRSSFLFGSEMITIYRKPNSVFINCIPNPDHIASITKFGLLRKRRRIFEYILLSIKNGTPIKDRGYKWTLIDYIIRFFGYGFCILFIVLAVFIIEGGDYIFGIFIGLIGLVILITDLLNVYKKNIP